MAQRFALGLLLQTPGVRDLGIDLRPYLLRHAMGDWGDMCAEDLRANEEAITTGARLFSAYALPGGQRLWIITEADRSSTTALLPEEY